MVVGLAASISPMPVTPAVLNRDLPVMVSITIALLLFGYRRGGGGRINRFEGAALLTAYVAYLGWIAVQAAGQAGEALASG